MTDPLAATLQRTLGDGYRVERELGGGGMSRVFVAHDLSLDRDVVIKVLSGEATVGVSADRFRREIQLIARMQHPHVVSILSAGAADGSLYYTMPYVAGETLRARITREGALPVPDVVRLLREVLDALAFAHEHGVVHRDIKPENVLVSAGHAVVADFGIAKALTESGTLTSAGFALGTPTYMAPEQATADPSTDHRADLYSVGVLGYELLTGAPPFTGTAQQVITQHLTVAPVAIATRRADAPDALAGVIERALAKDPAARPQSAREMIGALDGMTTPAATPSRAARRMSKTYQLPLAAAGVVVLVAAGVYAIRARETSPPAAPVAPVASGADLIAVMPLSAVSDTSLARLGQDLVVTLSTNLDGVGSLHTVDAATLLMRARKLPSPLPLADARAAARDLGARSVLTGTLINEGNRVRASVTLHQVGSDSVIAKASALAAPHDIAALTDSLTWSVLQQVWRRGTPPSPILAGLTTRSVDALRAFLDGEREFQRLSADAALADFRRAFELDSNFVQALLRYHDVNGWRVAPPDTQVLRRLLALKDRLPERERLSLEMSQRRLPFPERLAAWKALLARYPDYPPVLMATADPIVHSGPYYGIPLTEARPTLDRLEELVPEHADTRFHQALTSLETESADSIAVTTAAAARVMGSPWGPVLELASRLHAAHASGKPLPPAEAAFPAARALVAASRSPTPYYASLGMLGVDAHFAAYKLDALDRVRAAGIYTGDVDVKSSLGEGMLRLSRGDWMNGLRALRRFEGSSTSLGERMSGARLACIGAWLGVVDAATADSALRRMRASQGSDATLLDRVELLWLDGFLGIVNSDASRMQSARRALLADTSAAARRSARSLDGLWLERTDHDAGADTLRAVTEAAMREGNFPMSIEAIDRLVVARALRRRGSPADAERYLMWPDAQTNSVRNFAVKFALGPLVSYERGLAFEEAGNRRAATFQLQRFVEAYDLPPAQHRELVNDAKRRLTALGATDVPQTSRVAPR